LRGGPTTSWTSAPGRRRARRLRGWPRGTPEEESWRWRGSATGQYLAGKRSIPVGPASRRRATGQHRHRGRHPAQPPEGEREGSRWGRVHLRDGGVRARGKSTLVNEGALQGRGQQASTRPSCVRGAAPEGHGARPGRQDHQHRPVADRAHARRSETRPPTRAPSTRSANLFFPHPGGAGPRGVQAGTLLVQRQGAGRCEVCRGDGQNQDRDALSSPTCTCRASSATAKRLQPRDARRALQGQDDLGRAPRCRVEEAVEFLQEHPEDQGAGLQGAERRGAWATSGWASPGQPRCRAARGAAREAGHRARQGGRPAGTPLHPRRAHHGPCTSRMLQTLLEMPAALVDQGNSVVVIEQQPRT